MGTAQSGGMRTSWPPHHVDGKDVKMATFAGGCFWGLELAYQRKPGVLRTCVGYTQGHVERPTYRQVCSGRTGHTEAVQLTYDTRQVTYPELVDLFFDRIDPTALNRQGNDVGTQYRTGIYYHDEEQKREAEKAKSKIPGAVTEVLPAATFWPAEDYHQQYLEKGGQSAEKTCKDPIRCYG